VLLFEAAAVLFYGAAYGDIRSYESKVMAVISPYAAP
jgi:hypothetical protein